ncbi:hypothetical protein DYB28_013778 [Aphanomyces astaci]|uniref:Peptidase A2 domain-containing protein n=1 Tax=Aphanomyces astaci TaxID=112090 RepID=A0A9X8H691_APHAT|nr:hypothetical protein DYB28_013778 [Aphanomyces astaci]
MRQQNYKVEELNQNVRRDSERWGLFAEATNQRSPFPSEQAAPTSRMENLMGVQQVPLAPMYKGSTKRERREFMTEYLAYSRRVEVLNRGMGGTMFLMPLAACIDQKIVPRVCAHDFGKSFEEITLAMDPKPEPNRPRQYGEKPRRQLPPKKADSGAPARAPAMTATSAPYARGCLKCGSEDHKVLKCPKCQPGEAQRLLDQRFKKPHVAAVAAPDKKTDKKTKFIGAAVAANDVVEARAHRTLDCDINGLKATTLLDSGADQSVLSPTFLSRLEETGNFTSPVRELDDAMELGGFMEGMKLDVDRDVKLRLTFETAEGTLVIANLKCWVAAAPLQDGLGDLIVSRDVMAKLGYCPRSLLLSARRAQSVYDLDQLGGKDTPLMAAMKVVEEMEKLPSSPEEASLYPEEEQACFPQVTPDWSKENDQAVVRAKLKDKISECRAAGCGEDFAAALWALLLRYEDVFRLSLGRDPPVDVAPLRVTLKAGAEPVRCKARRYSMEQRDFMAKHVMASP